MLAFDNVQSVAFRGLHVDEALEVGSKSYLNYEGCMILKILYVWCNMFGEINVLKHTYRPPPQIRVQNVKSLVLESSTFSHLPPGSVQVDRTGKVSHLHWTIQKSPFLFDKNIKESNPPSLSFISHYCAQHNCASRIIFLSIIYLQYQKATYESG